VSSSEIAGLTKEHSDKILNLLKSHIPVKEIILFGSRAKGNYREGSDIDIALKGVGVDVYNSMALANEDLFLPWKLDLVAYDIIEAPELKSHIDRLGKVLYRRT
jgi:uncharacterized protein